MSESSLARLRIGQYSVSPELFEKGYCGGDGPCTCSSVCCSHGVYIDVTERDRILAHVEIIRRQMDDTQDRDVSAWFDNTESPDADFPSGRCVSTQVVNEKCAFLDKAGRCSLQVAAASEGMPKWALKPLFCILFPIEITDNVIGFDDLLDNEQPCCTIKKEFDTPMFEACKEELIHLLGRDGFQQAEEFYRTLASSRPTLSPPQENA